MGFYSYMRHGRRSGFSRSEWKWYEEKLEQLEGVAAKAAIMESNEWGGKPQQNLFSILGKLPKTYEDAARAYINHDVLSGSIGKVCESAASVPIKFYDRSSVDRGPGQWKESKSKLAEALRRVNPTAGPVAHWRDTYFYLHIGGEAYWWFEAAGYVWNFRPDRYEVKTDSRGLPAKYIYTIDNNSQAHSPEEVLHIKQFHPLSDHYGLSAVLTSALVIEADFFMQSYQRDFFKNDAKPPFLLIAKSAWGEEERKRFLSMWNKMNAGVGNKHRSALIENSDVDVKDLSKSMSDSEFGQGQDRNRQRIYSRYGTPPSIMSDNAANYATAREQKEAFWLGTVLPLINGVLDQFNTWDRAERENVMAIANPWAHPQVRQVFLMRMKDSMPVVQNGAMTINDLRRSYDLPPYAWGDEWHKPQNLYPASEVPLLPPGNGGKGLGGSVGSLSNYYEERKPKDRPGHSNKSARYELRRAKWKSFDPKAKNAELAWVKYFAPIYRKQRDRVLSALEKQESRIESLAAAFSIVPVSTVGGSVKRLFDLHETKGSEIEALIKTVFDLKAEIEKFKDASKEPITGLVKRWGGDAVAEAGRGGTFDESDPNVLEFIKQKEIKFATAVNQTTRDQLERILVNGVDSGASVREMAESIREVFSGLDGEREGRAYTIARTEVQASANFGQMEGYHQAEVEEKEWVTSGDELVRESHASIDGEVVSLRDEFSIGVMFPGDPNGSAEEVINCRCTIAPVV